MTAKESSRPPAGGEGLTVPIEARTDFAELLASYSRKPVPTGRVRRMWCLGTLQARVAVDYLGWWLARGFRSQREREDRLEEIHVRAALRVLGTLSHMRGAALKIGQVVAHWPSVTPNSFANILACLTNQVPPMQFALLRERVIRELGGDPHGIFESFEEGAFAAASLGQVHRARAHGRALAVKVQYPGIAQSLEDDIRNLRLISFPSRLSRDWQNLLDQYAGIQSMLQSEVDYESEAHHLNRARAILADLEGVVVPAPVDEFSTRRILTMEHIEGLHLDPFLATEPSQQQRDHFGELLVRASLRLLHSGRMVYADPHPGNYLFMADGRLGLVDFGCCHLFDDEESAYLEEVHAASLSGDQERILRVLAHGCDLEPEALSPERARAMLDYGDWAWEPLLTEGPYDYGAPGQFERGLEVWGVFIRNRWTRSLPVNVWLTRWMFGIRALLTRLGARVDYGRIAREESANSTAG